MKLAMISCAKYSDTWNPFIKLLNHFWPDHPPITLITDELPIKAENGYDDVFAHDSPSWCKILTEFAASCELKDAPSLHIQRSQPVLLMQDDFFINAPVRTDLVAAGLRQLQLMNAGCVRLYPCPGGEEEYGDPHYAVVPRGTKYRISCQAAIWDSDYLKRIASQFDTPSDFEIKGSALSDTHIRRPIIAFKRNVQPWPIQYLCSAIGRGMWSQDAKRLCDSLNIEVDWSRRPFQAA